MAEVFYLFAPRALRIGGFILKSSEKILIVKNSFEGISFLLGLVMVKKKVDRIIQVGKSQDDEFLNTHLKKYGYPKREILHINPLVLFNKFLIEATDISTFLSLDSLILDVSPDRVEVLNYQRLWNWGEEELKSIYSLSHGPFVA